MRLSSLPLFLCLLVSASATFRNKEKRVKEGGKKEEGGGCFEVYHTEEQLQYSDVCEQSFREVCGTEYSQECYDEPTTMPRRAERKDGEVLQARRGSIEPQGLQPSSSPSLPPGALPELSQGAVHSTCQGASPGLSVSRLRSAQGPR